MNKDIEKCQPDDVQKNKQKHQQSQWGESSEEHEYLYNLRC